MKKIVSVLLITLIAVAGVFALDTSKISVGVGAGVANDAIVIMGRGEYSKLAIDLYGFDLAVRGDYEVSEGLAVTAVFNWNVEAKAAFRSKTDFFAIPTRAEINNIDNVHYLGLTAGVTGVVFSNNAFSIALTGGVETRVFCNDGKFDLGPRGLVKASYAITDSHFTVDVTVGASYYFIRSGEITKNLEEAAGGLIKIFPGNYTALCGVTYKF